MWFPPPPQPNIKCCQLKYYSKTLYILYCSCCYCSNLCNFRQPSVLFMNRFGIMNKLTTSVKNTVINHAYNYQSSKNEDYERKEVCFFSLLLFFSEQKVTSERHHKQCLHSLDWQLLVPPPWWPVSSGTVLMSARNDWSIRSLFRNDVGAFCNSQCIILNGRKSGHYLIIFDY